MRSWSDSIDPSTIPDEVLRHERAIRNARKKERHTGGRNGGRPPKPRCRCGAMTLDAAAKRGHQC